MSISLQLNVFSEFHSRLGGESPVGMTRCAGVPLKAHSVDGIYVLRVWRHIRCVHRGFTLLLPCQGTNRTSSVRMIEF